MSDTPLQVRAYFEEGWEEDYDSRFYRRLPNVQVQWIDPGTGRPAIPIPSATSKALGTVFLALLSSSVLSDTIKTTLVKEPIKITLSIHKDGETRELHFEGPNNEQSHEDVERLIDEFTKDYKGNVQVIAKRKKHTHHAAPKPPKDACPAP